MRQTFIYISALMLVFSVNLNAQTDESYYFSKKVDLSFTEATTKLKDVLKEQGFGVMTELDMHEKLAEKLENVEMKPYKILGFCNPKFAYQTVQEEENVGLFLPCKVLVKEIDDNSSEIVMVNPSYVMQMLNNEELVNIADEVTERFKTALKNL